MRTTPESPFGEYFTGSIGDVEIWQGWPDDFVYLDDVQSEYYVSPETNVEPVPVIDLRAVAAAEGGEPYPAGSKSSPWVDLAGNRQDAALTNFCDLPNSGWLGDGSTESPYRLSFDGDGDVAVIEAGTVPELDETLEQTVELWVNVEAAEHVMYLIDWREALDGENGMSLIYNAGTLELRLGTTWQEVATIDTNTWNDIVVTKRPGEAAVFINGTRAFTSQLVGAGRPNSEIVIGGSTQGLHRYGDYLKGSIASCTIWRGVIADTTVYSRYTGREELFARVGPSGRGDTKQVFELAGTAPNPVRGTASVTFSLPTSAPARLQMLDVQGRVAWGMDVGNLGSGRHTIKIGSGGVQPRPGVYWLRLSQGARAQIKKIVVIK